MTDQTTTWAVLAARAADSKQGEDTVVFEVGDLMAITDYFVITSASNARAVRTIADEVEAQVSLAGGPKPTRVEGLSDARWVLMDYVDFVVHVFLDEARKYYELERLWADVPRVTWQDPAVPG